MIDNTCIIYCASKLDIEELRREVSSLLRLEKVSTSFFESSKLEISIIFNNDFNEELQYDFPDGFLHFRYILEIIPAKSTPISSVIIFVNAILTHLWSLDFSTVAACDYEEKLSHLGGYKDQTLPWPNK